MISLYLCGLLRIYELQNVKYTKQRIASPDPTINYETKSPGLLDQLEQVLNCSILPFIPFIRQKQSR